MKDISEYTLKECLEEVEMLHGGYGFRDPEKLADRIHDLTRWIPVSERMPNIDDAYRKTVLWIDDHGFIIKAHYDQRHDILKWVAWQRITPPEGV